MIDCYEKKEYFEMIEKFLKQKTITSTILRSLDDVFEELMPEEIFEENRGKSADEKRTVYINYVQKNIEKYKIKKKSILQKKIEYFAELFNLDEQEIKILEIIIKYRIISDFEHLIDKFYTISYRSRLECTCIQKITGINIRKIEATISKLVSLGILNDCPDLNMSEKISNLFFNYGIYKKSQINNYVLGKNNKSSLKEKDFPHLKKEIGIIKKILNSAIETKQKGINILFWGDVGTGKTELVRTIACECNTKLYEVGNVDDYGAEMSRRERIADFKRKQCILNSTTNTCILFDEMEDLIEIGVKNSSKSYINQMLEENQIPTFWTTNDITFLDNAFLRRMTYAVEFKELSDELRLNIWKKELKKNHLKIDQTKLSELNNSYNIPISIITNAIKSTKLTNGDTNDFEEYVDCISKLVNNGRSAKKNPHFNLKNYNLSLVNSNIDIENLTGRIIQKGKMNFSMCLYGQSGTGKSAYAKYLAEKLGIKAILKKASDLMSPYVGETEINIAKAFKEAKDNKAMLIIDEADSFLQSRQNAQHNWEVTQVNEMLTDMESHEYPFICTTNLVDILDEASLRRFTFKIKFGFMEQEQVRFSFEHFFGLSVAENECNIQGLTPGDFATVKKKNEFLDLTDFDEIKSMLIDEVKIKKSKELSNSIGFSF